MTNRCLSTEHKFSIQCHSVCFPALIKRNKYNYVNITSKEYTKVSVFLLFHILGL